MSFKLYEIDNLLREALESAPVNEETGELSDDWGNFLDGIQMERDKKCLAVGAIIREFSAEAESVKSEKQRLAKRQSVIDNKIERLKNYLSTAVNVGEKLSDSRVQISWRKSTAVNVINPDLIPDSYCKIERSVMKTDLKKAIESGEYTGLGASIVVSQNIQIK
jgi:hypothetical protein